MVSLPKHGQYNTRLPMYESEQDCVLTVVISILCGDYAIKSIDAPFINENENTADWEI